MFDISGGIALPSPSVADRDVPAASKGHCTAHAVLGDGEGTRVQAESWLELCHQMLLNADEEVAELAEQQRFIFGEDEDDLREHIFDVIATLHDGYRIAYTIKPEIRLASGVFLEEMAEITANIFAVSEWTSIVQPDDEELAPAKVAPKRSRKRKTRG
ncbi:hypothetical protein [Tropicibacter naphthalenivorans]|uniref:Uncharacterized protein n=1 Tax=Tropicibacter naphthalenivorans TaxID=441103 RepID=A0A0P1H1Y0_9RHOB|nr:hypothetical protein [Tropicibacter naphthalenivorans]CUH81024.1 hypothetical protein TRN7648_03294 [Tropicibacter naphthalenivorans]SMC92040.1 hypothetical protein SAMN04488093_106266 [Tropicibacter naphthalenivorans]